MATDDVVFHHVVDFLPGGYPQLSLTFEAVEVFAMRLEATVPDNRGSAVVQLADELGLSRSQLIDEALSLFLKAVLEVRRGRRLVTLDPGSSAPACELVTPTLSALEWALKPENVELPTEALEKMRALAESAPAPKPRLRAAAKRHGN